MTDIETRDIPLSWEVFVIPGIPMSPATCLQA
jgi:hypothetical protein